MRRQLRALDRAATAGPGLRRKAKPRRTTGPVLPGLLISGILAGAVMLYNPGMTGYRFRQLMDHLSGNGGGSYAFVVTTLPRGVRMTNSVRNKYGSTSSDSVSGERFIVCATASTPAGPPPNALMIVVR